MDLKEKILDISLHRYMSYVGKYGIFPGMGI
jgi:hypothetical protein